jgi:hypothetical protein
MKSVTKYSPSKMEPVSVNQLVDIIFFWFMLEPVPLLDIFIYFFVSLVVLINLVVPAYWYLNLLRCFFLYHPE